MGVSAVSAAAQQLQQARPVQPAPQGQQAQQAIAQIGASTLSSPGVEARETPQQTAQEAAHGNIQAKQLLAKEQAAKAAQAAAGIGRHVNTAS